MTFLSELRQWLERRPMSPDSHRPADDSLESRSILELADSLRLLEGDVREIARKVEEKGKPQPVATEVAPEAFRITGPGRYRMRNGGIDVLKWSRSGEVLLATASGFYFSNHGDGRVYSNLQTGNDIIEGPLRDSEPTAGLTGYIADSTRTGNSFFKCDDREQAQRYADRGGIVLDCEKIPASAVVSPDKNERRRIEGWINIHRAYIHRAYRSNAPRTNLQGGIIYFTREEADSAPGAKNRVDCIKIAVAAGTSCSLDGGIP